MPAQVRVDGVEGSMAGEPAASASGFSQVMAL